MGAGRRKMGSNGQLELDPLTERELEVLGLIAEGLTNREIAHTLVLALGTVKWYNRQIYSKLGAHSRREAVTQAREAGLLEADVVPRRGPWLYGAFGGALVVVAVAGLLFSGLIPASVRPAAEGAASAPAWGEDGVLIIEAHTGPARGVAWSPDGARLASASDDNSVKVWDAESGEAVFALTGHTDDATSVVWSPDGTRLASGSDDNAVFVWDAENGTLLETLQAYASDITSVAWSPDGERLVSGDSTGRVMVWDPDAFELLGTMDGLADRVVSLGWSADSGTLMGASADHVVILWDAGTREPVRRLTTDDGDFPEYYYYTFTAALSPGGERLTIEGDHRGIAVVYADTGETIFEESDVTSIRSSAWSPDGARLALGSGTGEVVLWDGVNGERLRVLDGGQAAMHSVAWSPDGKRLVAATERGRLIVWDLERLADTED